MKVKAIHIKTLDFGPLVYRTVDKTMFYHQHYLMMEKMGDEYHHVYWVSDKPAQDGDVYYDSHNNMICVANINSDHKVYLYKKVVACTDYDFCEKNNIYPLGDEFVIKFAYNFNNGDKEMIFDYFQLDRKELLNINVEKIFDDSAKENMVNWDIESFKKSHPKLFKSIIQALNKASKF